MTNRVLIRHEFIMTADAIPIPVVQKKRTGIGICIHCHNVFYEQVRDGRCSKCYSYKARNGKDRPRRYFVISILCSNPNCRRLLSDDKYAKRFLCNACYVYKNRYGIIRPLKLCKRYGDQNNV